MEDPGGKEEWLAGEWVGVQPHSLGVSLQMYGRLYRVVEPKRIRMNAALAQLQEKQAALAEAQEKLREVSLMPVFSAVAPLPNFQDASLPFVSSHLILPAPLPFSPVCLPCYALFRWAAAGSES